MQNIVIFCLKICTCQKKAVPLHRKQLEHIITNKVKCYYK